MSDLVKKETTALANPIQAVGLDPREIQIPLVLVRQPTFKKDHMRPFQPGDILKMPGAVPVCKYKDTVDIVPLAIKKQYRVLDVTKASEPKQVRYEDWRADAEWQFIEDGKNMRRDQCYSVFFMFREDLERQMGMLSALEKGEIVDPDDFALPCRAVFARAAFQHGKTLSAHFELSKAANNQSPAAITWCLRSEEKTNEHGTWYIFAVDKAPRERKMTPKELLPAANFWVSQLQGNVKLVEEDEVIDIPAARDEEVAAF